MRPPGPAPTSPRRRAPTAGGFQAVLVPEVAHRGSVALRRLPTGGFQAVLVPEVALHGAERPDFLLLPRRPAEVAALYYRFLNRRVDVPLHPSWAVWLWDRARSDGEAEQARARVG